MRRIRYVIVGLWALMFFSGCAGMQSSSFEQPVVSLSSFRMLPQASGSPIFEIGLSILNPNRDSLSFEGIFYTISIEGYEVIAGVSNDLPRVEPYGKADILLEAGVDVITSVKLLSSIIQQPRDRLTYSFRAKLDPGGFHPRITLEEEGEFSLQP